MLAQHCAVGMHREASHSCVSMTRVKKAGVSPVAGGKQQEIDEEHFHRTADVTLGELLQNVDSFLEKRGGDSMRVDMTEGALLHCVSSLKASFSAMAGWGAAGPFPGLLHAHVHRTGSATATKLPFALQCAPQRKSAEFVSTAVVQASCGFSCARAAGCWWRRM